jgi:hypothetical protein
MDSNEFHRLRGTLLFGCEKGGEYKGHHLADVEWPAIQIHLYPGNPDVRRGLQECNMALVEVHGRYLRDGDRIVMLVNFLRQVFPTPGVAQA